MIDHVTLANVIDEEARIRAQQLPPGSDTTLTAAERLARQLQKSPLPPTERLAVVLEEMFWASLLEEEGRPCRPRLLYTLGDGASTSGHWFDEPVPLSRETLRKLAPIQGRHGFLTWTIGARGPVIIGVETTPGDAFIVSAPAPGAIDAVWSGWRILTMRGGEVRRLSTCALPDATKVFDVVKDAIGGMPNVLVSTLLTIAEDGHGGSLWLVSESSRGPTPRTIAGVRMGVVLKPGPPPLERFADEADRQRWIASVAHLASVDGAVVLDAAARILGFSAFVETGPPVPLIELLPSGGTRRISSPDTGGGRHRAAAEFCRRVAPGAALVVSSDGRISVFAARRRDQPPLFSEVISLGMNLVPPAL